MSIEFQKLHPDSMTNQINSRDSEWAAKLLDVNPEELVEFHELDTFNNNVPISGFLCRRSDYRYGCLVLKTICGILCEEQVIYATPKIEYPFNLEGVYNFPDCNIIEFFEKLDGTNILAYHYTFQDKDYVTFKTRLTPILKDQKFGMFKSMWEEYRKENSWIDKVIQMNPDFNLSFELFGSRNPITINYDVPLEVNLLFGVRRTDHAIRPCTDLMCLSDVKMPRCYTMTGDDHTDVITMYNKHREHMSLKNKEELTIEGLVQYCHVGLPSWKMFKCKPEEIEKIHWAASGSIPRISLYNTAINVFESSENPTIADFIELLKEEYPLELITKSTYKIEKAWGMAYDQIKFTDEVNEIWFKAKNAGLDIMKDKNETMRFISQYYPKEKMKKVGTIVLQQAGLLKIKLKHV